MGRVSACYSEDHDGWRSFFVVLHLGLPDLAVGFWLKWMPRTPIAESDLSQAPGIVAAILEQKSAWGTCVGLFSVNYLSYFLLTWLPFYLVRERHFSMNKMANVAGNAYLAAAVVATFCGWLSDRWIEAGTLHPRA